MGIETFDDFSSTEGMVEIGEIKPFQFREDKTNKGTLEWLNSSFDSCLRNAQSRMETYRRWMSMYKNIHWRSNDPRDTNRTTITDVGKRNPKVSVNFIYETTEAKTSQRSRNKIGVTVIPNTDEQNDINDAKLCKMILDNRCDEIDFDMKNQVMDRIMFHMGHSFMYIKWDKFSGPDHPVWAKAKQKWKDKIPPKLFSYLKERGIDLKKDGYKVGDVTCEPIGAERVFPELGKKRWEDVNAVDILTWKHIEEVKHDYPEFADKIKETTDYRNMYTFDLDDRTVYKNMIAVHDFWHKPTRHYPKGCHIIWVKDVILEEEDFPYDHGMLPLVEDKDIDIYNEFWGRSYVGQIESMQRMYNNIQSCIARNEGITAHPKWVLPKGSCKFTSLGNEITIAEFTGPVPPKLVENNGTHPRSLEIQDRLEKKIMQHSTVYDISRGQVPTGVTANSALRFLDEQETQRDQTGVAKRKSRVLRELKMMLALMGQYYKPNDGRTIRIVGKDNEYLIESMQKADFTKAYDVRLQNSSALPDTKTGKISTIIDLNMATQNDPIFKKEEVIQMMDLGLDESFKNQATVAVSAAHTIVDQLLRGVKGLEPHVSDNFMVHYEVLNRTLQSFVFKTKTSPETQKAVQEYVLTLEGLMWERAKKNPKFLTELMSIDMYPMFFQPEGTLIQLAQMNAVQPPQNVPPPNSGAVNTDKIKSLQNQQGVSDGRPG